MLVKGIVINLVVYRFVMHHVRTEAGYLLCTLPAHDQSTIMIVRAAENAVRQLKFFETLCNATFPEEVLTRWSPSKLWLDRSYT